MHFKDLLVTMLLFFSITPLFAQDQEQDCPCLNVERMRKKLTEVAKRFIQEEGDKVDLSEKKSKKRLIFMQKFLTLSKEEQKKKIEKLLAPEPRRRVLGYCNYLTEAFKNKRFDEETIDCLDKLRQEGYQENLKVEILVFSCSELIREEISNEEMRGYIKELEIKQFFSQRRKEEMQKFEERKKELLELREKALNEYDCLADFFDNQENYKKTLKMY